MYNLIIKARAVQMAKKAWEWYEEQQAGLGDRFLLALESSYAKIKKEPMLCAKIQKDFRHAVVNVFPYVVIFEIIDDDIVVYAVFHTSRNPQRKFRKR